MNINNCLKYITVSISTILLFIILTPGQIYASGWLHTDDNKIKDPDGNTVMLRGVHMYVCLKNEQEKFTQA